MKFEDFELIYNENRIWQGVGCGFELLLYGEKLLFNLLEFLQHIHMDHLFFSSWGITSRHP